MILHRISPENWSDDEIEIHTDAIEIDDDSSDDEVSEVHETQKHLIPLILF